MDRHSLYARLASMGISPAEVEGMSDASLRALAFGVRGGDGPTDPPAPADPPAPEGDGDPATPPAEGDPAPAEGDPAPAEGDPAPEASVTVPELPEDVTAVDEADLRALFGELETLRAEQLPLVTTAEGVSMIETIVERQSTIAAELQRRLDEAAQIAERTQALAAADPIVLPGPAPVLASAAAVVAARGTQPPAAQNPPAPTPPRPRVAIQAGVGNDVLDEQGLSLDRLGALIDRQKQGGDAKVYLAGLPAYEVEWEANGLPEPLSRMNSTARNDALIGEAVDDFRALRRGEQPARVAAAGGVRQGAICEPLEVIRDIPDAFSTVEVVGPAFPSRPMGRGGFTYTPSMSLSTIAAGVGLWDEDDQAAVDPDDASTWKPIVDLTCPDPTSIKMEFVTAAVRFDNTLEMSNPERVRNALNALMAVKARTKEGRLLQRIDSLSHRYTFGLEYGAVPTLIRALNTVLAQATYANRLEGDTYTLFLPPGVPQILLSDRAAKGYNDAEVNDLMAYIRDNVAGLGSVVSTLDASLGGEGGVPFSAFNAVGNAATELPKLGNVYRIRLVDPAGAIYAETGEVNTGVERSPELRRQNKAQLFAEEGFVLAKHGPQPWFAMDVELCDNGDRAGLTDPFICSAAS